MIDREVAPTSSIGPTWPPEHTFFDRVKGIDTREIVRSEEQLMELVELVRSADLEPGKRISLRAFVTTPMVASHAGYVSDVAEASMPLVGAGDGLDGTSILYLGKNGSERKPNPFEIQHSIANVQKASKRPSAFYAEIMNRFAENDFTVSELDVDTRMCNLDVRRQMAHLYERFGWEVEEVMEILRRPGNIISVVKLGEKIVSTALAETKQLQVGRQTIRIAEITEAATDNEFQGRGLYSVAEALLIKMLAESGTHVAFGECNGDSQGVLNASHTVGRRFAWEVSQDYALPFKGYLPQHVPISGTQRSTPYNDLFPSFITRREMRHFVEQ